MGHRSELDRLRQQRDELALMLGQHRQTVSLHGRLTHPAAAMCCPGHCATTDTTLQCAVDDLLPSTFEFQEPWHQCERFGVTRCRCLR